MSLPRQLVGFVVSGGLATAADALVYAGLRAADLPGGADAAKALSFVVGTLVSFELNRRLTFGAPRREARQAGAFFALYAATFLLNVGVNHAALGLLPPSPYAPTAAFVGATACSMVANFVGQRAWVFRPLEP